MNLSRYILLLCSFFFLCGGTIFAEKTVLDSLNDLLATEQSKSKKVKLLNELFSEQYSTDYNKALKYAQEALKVSKTIKNESRQTKQNISQSANNVGNAYFFLDKYEKALKYYLMSLKVAEEITDTNMMANTLYNLGSLYDFKGETEKGFQYLEQAVKLEEQRGDMESAAISYSSMADYYFFNADYNKGMIYYEKAMKIVKPLNNKSMVASLYGSRAVGLKHINRYNKSLKFHQLSITIKIELNDKTALHTAYLNIADVYIAMKEYEKAVEFNLKSLEIAKELDATESIMIAYKGLSETYTQMGSTSKALEYTQLYADWKDTLYGQQNAEAIAEMQTKYDTEKKEAENSLLIAEKELDKAELDKKSNQQKMLGIGLGLSLLVVVYVAYSLNQKKKTNKLLNVQNEEISSKNEIIEEKNKDITDSINYAQRIQDAILPEESILKQHYESFIYYRPKDIVSGDFYWIKETENKLFFSVVDCTGHGVPGAFMSIIGANSLSKIVEDLGVESTGEILDELNKLVNQALGKNSNPDDDIISIRDGMDISICSVDKSNNTLEYSGANNSLYILRKPQNKIDGLEFIMEDERSIFYEIKPNKMAIGGGQNKEKYRSHKFQLSKDDAVYLFSDGYADQFGGEKEKKFMYKRFKKMFLSIQNQTMDKQLIHLTETMENWKGDIDQLDDICVMGVKI